MNAEEYKEKLWKMSKQDLRDIYISHGKCTCEMSKLELVYQLCQLELGYNVGRK